MTPTARERLDSAAIRLGYSEFLSLCEDEPHMAAIAACKAILDAEKAARALGRAGKAILECKIALKKSNEDVISYSSDAEYWQKRAFETEARCAALREPFKFADDGDWDFILRALPKADLPVGNFWFTALTQLRAALAAAKEGPASSNGLDGVCQAPD